MALPLYSFFTSSIINIIFNFMFYYPIISFADIGNKNKNCLNLSLAIFGLPLSITLKYLSFLVPVKGIGTPKSTLQVWTFATKS